MQFSKIILALGFAAAAVALAVPEAAPVEHKGKSSHILGFVDESCAYMWKTSSVRLRWVRARLPKIF